MSIGEFYRIKKANFSSQWEVIRLYYLTNWRFALCDLFLGICSLFFNPYRVCRKKGWVYGETPISSLRQIIAFCHISSSDLWLELGSGRGKSCFWISQWIGCRVIGVERVTLFVCLARTICWLFRLKGLCFIKADIADVDFSSATCVYLYSTCMSEEKLALLARNMETLPSGAKVVTISSPLPKTSHLELIGSFPLSFPWGDTEGYLHIRTRSH